MSRLSWHNVGKRFFSAGVDRGVLYVDDNPGVVWNGLVAVTESPTGGEAKPQYLDGVKVRDLVTKQEYKATIEAFTYPDEFAKCEGTTLLGNGLFATAQKKKTFGFSYRTYLGNEVHLLNYAYKIHLVYNAVAKPAQLTQTTIADTVTPSAFSWDISATPPRFSGVQPTAHYVIDASKTPESLLDQIEDILYGTEIDDPRLPALEELLFIFQDYNPTMFDPGFVGDPYYSLIDAGYISEPQTSTLDGGTP